MGNFVYPNPYEVGVAGGLATLDGTGHVPDAQISSAIARDSEISSLVSFHTGASSAHGVSGAVVGTTDAQTLTDKTLTSPTINGATLSGSVTSTATITGGTVNPATLQKNGVNAILASGTQSIADGLTITTPVIASIKTGGGSATLTLPSSTDTLVGRSTTDTLANKTLSSAVENLPLLTGPRESVSLVGSGATGTVNIDVETAHVWYYTASAGGNFTINFRQSSSATLASLLAVGHSITVTVLNTNGATAYYPNAFQIDGSTATIKWQYGSAPASGSASAVDAYTFTIIKTAATPAYVVLGSFVKFS